MRAMVLLARCHLMRTIEYFFTVQSPWCYIGHAAFMDLAARQGAHVDFRPMNLGKIFPETGGLPLAKRHPARQRYRLLELQRWVLKRSLAMVEHPRFWPVDPSLGDRVVIAIAEASGDSKALDRVLAGLYAAVFEREENVADAATIATILLGAGLDADALLAAAQTDAVGLIYAENAALALSRGAVGAPSYCLDGELFWGQDRLDLLGDSLESGRAPFVAAI